MSETQALVKQAQLAMESLRDKHDWTRADFARALVDYLDEPPQVGSNFPPPDVVALMDQMPLQEILDALTTRMDLATPELRGRVNELEAAATPERMKAPQDDHAAGLIAEYIDLCGKAIKRADELHDEIKEPYLRAGKTVDGYFNALLDRLKRARGIASALGRDYAIAKREKERAFAAQRSAAYVRQGFEPPPEPVSRGKVHATGGVTLALQSRPDFEVVSYNKIPLVKLRDFLKREAVEMALRAYMLHHLKSDPDPAKVPALAGVRFYLRDDARVRS